MTGVDEVQIVLDALSTGWTKANTGAIKPTFKRIFDVKRIDLAPNADYVLGYSVAGSYAIRARGLGKNEWEEVVVSLDCRSTVSRQHSLDMRDEVMRVIRANMITVLGSKYNLIKLERVTDLTDKMTGIYRMVIDVRLTDFVVQVT
jgi:hypothetical protein